MTTWLPVTPSKHPALRHDELPTTVWENKLSHLERIMPYDVQQGWSQSRSNRASIGYLTPVNRLSAMLGRRT